MRKIRTSGLTPLSNKIKAITILCFGFLISCNKHDSELEIPLQEAIEIPISFEGLVQVHDKATFGRLENTELNDIQTYYLIELNKLDVGVPALAGLGVFDHVPDDLSVSVQSSTNYRLDIKAFQQGTGYGIFLNNDFSPPRLVYGTLMLPVTNEFDYSPADDIVVRSQNLAVYAASDSSITEYQTFPNFDSFYKEYSFGSDTTNDIHVQLERASFGVEILVDDLDAGQLEFALNPGSFETLFILDQMQDSLFEIVSHNWYNSNIRTKIDYVVDDMTYPLYDDVQLYGSSVVKRFEVTLPSLQSNSKPAFVNISDKPFVRGDTVLIGG